MKETKLKKDRKKKEEQDGNEPVIIDGGWSEDEVTNRITKTGEKLGHFNSTRKQYHSSKFKKM